MRWFSASLTLCEITNPLTPYPKTLPDWPIFESLNTFSWRHSRVNCICHQFSSLSGFPICSYCGHVLFWKLNNRTIFVRHTRFSMSRSWLWAPSRRTNLWQDRYLFLPEKKDKKASTLVRFSWYRVTKSTEPLELNISEWDFLIPRVKSHGFLRRSVFWWKFFFSLPRQYKFEETSKAESFVWYFRPLS